MRASYMEFNVYPLSQQSTRFLNFGVYLPWFESSIIFNTSESINFPFAYILWVICMPLI
jgi:hypothetical protein